MLAAISVVIDALLNGGNDSSTDEAGFLFHVESADFKGSPRQAAPWSLSSPGRRLPSRRHKRQKHGDGTLSKDYYNVVARARVCVCGCHPELITCCYK